MKMLVVAWALAASQAALAGSILFVGNSFTYGHGSPVMFYRPSTITDLNGTGLGGVPALFKSFTAQAGLSYDVFLESHPGVGLDWHLENELPMLRQQAWDTVILQSHSLLDPKKPGDPAVLVAAVHRLAGVLRERNPRVEIRLTATWTRADQTYQPGGAWYGKPVEAMAHDVRAGYVAAAAGTPGLAGVVEVGEAWLRAMHEGVAAANPYEGVGAGKLDLWTYDHYHASAYGYYLEALMLFGSVTGRDPRTLGQGECSGYELGFSTAQVAALERIAASQLAADGVVLAGAAKAAELPGRCALR